LRLLGRCTVCNSIYSLVLLLRWLLLLLLRAAGSTIGSTSSHILQQLLLLQLYKEGLHCWHRKRGWQPVPGADQFSHLPS
jgi:hypothetical protein